MAQEGQLGVWKTCILKAKNAGTGKRNTLTTVCDTNTSLFDLQAPGKKVCKTTVNVRIFKC